VCGARPAPIAERGPALYDLFSPNPPTTALLLLPLAGLDYTAARVVWTLLNLALLLLVVGWLLRQLDLRGIWLSGAVAFVLFFQPVYANLEQGQAYLLLLGLSVAAWHGYRTRQETVLGAALGLMLGMVFWWAVFPVLLGLVLGARLGAAGGKLIWQAGKRFGWGRLWAGLGGAGAAGFGWLLGSWAAAGGLDSLVTGWISGIPLGLLGTWLLAGALCGGLGGAMAGVIADLLARLAGLVD
jgi:hypothetical protein